MGDLILKIFNMSFNAGIMVLAILFIRLFTKKAPKCINVLLWGAVALRLSVPFSFESILSLLPSKEVINTVIPSAATSVLHAVPQVDIGVPSINNTVNEYIGETVVTVPNVEESFVNVILVLSIIWALGLFAMLIYATVSYIRLKVTVKISLCKENNIYYCDNITSPFILGIIKPKIYLPSDIAKEDEQYVLMHEMAHIKRKDYLWKPLGFLLLSVHWFNPLIWVGYAMLCRDIELACDEKAIKNMSKTEKINYSNALLNCSIPQNLITVNPLTFGGISVKKRIKNILDYQKPAMWITVIAIILSCALMAGFLTDPVDKKKEEKEQQKVETVTSQTEDTSDTSSEPTESIVSTPEESKPTESKPKDTSSDTIVSSSTPKETDESDKIINKYDNIGDLSLEKVREIKEYMSFFYVKSNSYGPNDFCITKNYGTFTDGSIVVDIDTVKSLNSHYTPTVITLCRSVTDVNGYITFHLPFVFNKGELLPLNKAFQEGLISKICAEKLFKYNPNLVYQGELYNKNDNCGNLNKTDIYKIKKHYALYLDIESSNKNNQKVELSDICIQKCYRESDSDKIIIAMSCDGVFSQQNTIVEEVGKYNYTHKEKEGIFIFTDYGNKPARSLWINNLTDWYKRNSKNENVNSYIDKIFKAFPEYVKD